MKKSTFLWGAIAILFLLNIATLVFMAYSRSSEHRPPPPPPEGNRRFDEQVIRTLKLSPEQVQRFDILKREHHQQMMELDEATDEPFRQYFGMLLNSKTDSLRKDSLEQHIASIYLEKVNLTYAHFEQLKAICTPEQQQYFVQLVPSLMQVITPDKKNPDQAEGEWSNCRIKENNGQFQFIPYDKKNPDQKCPDYGALRYNTAYCARLQERQQHR